MTLETQVAALVSTTTSLQNTVSQELAKVRSENTAFRATVIPKASQAPADNAIVVFDGTTGQAVKAVAGASVEPSGAGKFNGVYVGQGTAFKNDTNCAIGLGVSLEKLTTGSFNTAIGRLVLGFLTTGVANTGIGNGSLYSNTIGNHNTAVGHSALYECLDTGSWNTAVGSVALRSNTTGERNTATGNGALNNNTTGHGNVAVGNRALFSNTTGSLNVALGELALTATNFSSSVGLGVNSQVSGDNQVQLGSAASTVYTHNAIQSRSDRRDKTDIRPTKFGLDFIKRLKPVDYRWDMRDSYRPEIPASPPINASDDEVAAFESQLKAWQESARFENLKPDGSKKKKRYHHGLIAQDLQDLIKSTGEDFGAFQDHKISGGQDVLSIGYNELIAPLIKAVQELAQANEELRGRVAILEGSK